MKKDLAIVYIVAGISSRFGGKIKQLAKVGPNNETLIEYSLKQALKAGFNKIIFVVGNKTEKPFKEKFKDNYNNILIQYALQIYNENNRDKPWGTVDALCAIKDIINCPFVVCNGDDIYGENTFKILYNHLQKYNHSATIGYKLSESLPEQGAAHRGIFKTKDNIITEINETFNIEKSKLNKQNLTPDTLCSMNIFALFPETVHKLKEILQKFKENNKESRTIECLLPNEISNLIKTQNLKLQLYSTTDKWLGITNPEDEEIIRKKLNNITSSSH